MINGDYRLNICEKKKIKVFSLMCVWVEKGLLELYFNNALFFFIEREAKLNHHFILKKGSFLEIRRDYYFLT